jgi:type VI secretion system protein VasD
VAVAPNVNPDSRGRASPIVTRLFELKSLAAFQSADFFSLFDRDKETLGNDLVAKEELVLQPGENRQFKREMQADTRFVAMIAGYRDIERSRWRASTPVPLNETTIVTIAVQERDISIVNK